MDRKVLQTLLSITVLIMILLSACAPGQAAIPTELPTVVPTIKPSSTLTPTSSPLPTSSPTPTLSPTPTPPFASSETWFLQILSASWSDTSTEMTARPGYKILEVWINLEYRGVEADLKPSFSVINESSVSFVKVGLVSAGLDTPFDILSWISDYLGANPTSRHFVAGEKLGSLMLTFIGPENSQKFQFQFADLPPVDFTEIVIEK